MHSKDHILVVVICTLFSLECCALLALKLATGGGVEDCGCEQSAHHHSGSPACRLRQDNRSSEYNHFLLIMTELNITASENTSNIYHLPPVCVFAVRNRTASSPLTTILAVQPATKTIILVYAIIPSLSYLS